MSRLLVVEHKTSSEDIGAGSTYWKRLTIDNQITNYLEGARTIYGREPDGVLYDVVKKVKLELKLATPEDKRRITKAGKLDARQRDRDETLDEYRLRVRADISENPDKYYQRGEIVRMASEEHAAAYDTWMVGDAIRESINANAWPRNTASCVSAFGGFCDYWQVCTGEASIDDPLRYEVTPPRYDGHHLPVLSTSSAKCYRACPRRYFYEYQERKRPLQRAHALRFGTLFHKGLEVWWTTVDLLKSIEAMRNASTDAESEVDQVDLVNAEELMLGYHARWYREPYKVLGVEVAFHAPLVNPATGRASRTWIRGGQMDAVLEKE